MNREEILAKSQQENHGQDIVNLEVSKNGMQIGWVVIICLLAFVTARFSLLLLLQPPLSFSTNT